MATPLLFDASQTCIPLFFYTYTNLYFSFNAECFDAHAAGHSFMCTWMDMSETANTNFTACSQFYENSKR